MLPEGLTPDQYLELARDLYGRRARGDLEPALSFFHDDAVYRLSGSRALILGAGVRIGKVEIRQAWRATDVDFDILEFHIDDFVMNLPHNSYISWRMRMKNRGTGAVADFEGVDRFSWRDRKIAEWTRFLDTALAASLAEHDRNGDAG